MSHTLPVTGNTDHTSPQNRAFYPALDGLRAVAFLMVFLGHYEGMPWGWTGVNVFFVLSGFLITGILFDTRDDRHRARNFYIRRTLRIFPLYYGILLVVVLLYPLMRWQWSAAWIAWPLYCGNFLRLSSPAAAVPGSSLQNAANGWLHSLRFPNAFFLIGHFWSLCVEEQFYLFWPWLVFLVGKRTRLLWLCGAVVIADCVLRVIAQHVAPPWMIGQDMLHSSTPFALDGLFLGGFISLLWRGRFRIELVRACRFLAVSMTVVAVIVLGLTIHPSQINWFNGYIYPKAFQTAGIPFANVLSAALLVWVLEPRGLLYRLLSLRPLRWLGRISYGAYVFHDLFHLWYRAEFFHLCNSAVQHISPRFQVLQRHEDRLYPILAFACTVLIAWLSFRFFESPFLKLKDRWTKPHTMLTS